MPGGDRRHLADALTVGGYRTGAMLARLLPGPVAGALAGSIGVGANLVSFERRRMIERHLRRVDPTLRGVALRRAVQAAFDSYARYWVESFRLPTLSRRAVAAEMRVEGFEHIDAGLARGNGVILALPHLGGWEWAGRWMADIGHRLTVVVEAIDPPELLEWFAELRQRLGMMVVPLGPEATRSVLNALSNNEIVCLLCDRDIQGGGVEVEFFGERTTLPAGPAMLSLRTGAALLPTAVYFTKRGRGHFGLVRPHLTIERSGRLRVDVGVLTQALAHELEALIRRAPEQWHMFQPNWPSDPGYGA